MTRIKLIMGTGRAGCPRCGRMAPGAGFTLVEVVVSVALLAALLVGMLTAFNVHQRQVVRALEQRHALEVAEPLLAGWLAADSQVPRQAKGTIRSGQQRWYWTTRPGRRQRLARKAIVETIRFQMYLVDSRPARRRPVVTMELLRSVDNPFETGPEK